MFRTHTCGQLTKSDAGATVTLSGWVNGRRDHGGLIFIDLRDHYGMTQVVFDGKVSAEAFAIAEKLRDEWVVKITGKVNARPESATNKVLSTGAIEISVESAEILNSAQTPPFSLSWDPTKDDKLDGISEDLRLKYRFLDLRRKRMQDNLVFRGKVIKFLRDWMHQAGFNEIETPILTVSSPEGARDFLVPSRLHPGKFYALPQAPQQYKQLLMVGGMDRYFQVAPCMRDEDARADRSPGEFYQLDVETSFLTQDEFFALMEPMFEATTKEFTDRQILQMPFPRIPFRESMLKYGCDKPDLRFGMEIQDVTEMFDGCGFTAFADVVKNGGRVRAVMAPKGATLTKSDIEKINDEAKKQGAKGVASILIEESGEYNSMIVKFLGEDLVKQLAERLGAGKGDAMFFCADKEKIAAKVMGQVRLALGNKLDLIDRTKMAYCWIVDFPMFEYNEELKKIDFGHNPFSMPQGGMDALLNKDPLDILAYQYDIVLNGVELSSGAVRNNVPEVMYKAFEIAGYGPETVDAKFGHMIAAFKFGAPPHCGFAPGIERYVMLLRDEPSIREITAFPKNGRAEEPMVGSPSEVSQAQLDELRLKINLPVDEK